MIRSHTGIILSNCYSVVQVPILFGISFSDSIYDPPKGTTMGPLGIYMKPASAGLQSLVDRFFWLRGCKFPDPQEDPKSRSLNGGSYKVPLVV